MTDNKKIREFVLKLGITPDLLGYEYIVTAIEMLLTQGRIPFVKLYSDVAAAHKTTTSRAERDMRHAINKAVCEYGVEYFKSVFHCTILSDYYLTIGKFLALCAETLKHFE